MKSYHKKSFTLIELLVAMGLFSLLVMLMLQLFSGAQKLWIASDKRSNVYADARVAMEIMSDMLNSVVFSHGETSGGERNYSTDALFSLNNKTADKDTVTFIVKTNADLPKNQNNTRFISFRRGTTPADEGKLYMTVFSDDRCDLPLYSETIFYSLFAPYGIDGSGIANRADAKNKLDTLLAPTASTDNSADLNTQKYNQVIAENVVGLNMVAYVLSDDTPKKMTKQDDKSDIDKPPYMIQIQLTLMDRDNYKIYSEMEEDKAKTAFLERNKRTFTRNVYIGDRWALEIQ